MPRETLSHRDREQALARLASILRGLQTRRPEAIAAGQAPPGGGGGDGGETPDGSPGGVLTGWPGIDALGGLSRGLLHEWFGVAEPDAPPDSSAGAADSLESEGAPRPRRNAVGRQQVWTPPLRLLAALAARATAEPAGSLRGAGGAAGAAAGWVCWIGSRVWPYPRALIPREQVSSFETASASSTAEGERAAEGDRTAASRPGRRTGASVVPVSPDLLARSLFIDPPDDAVRLWAIDLALRCPALAAVVADGRGLTMPASRRLQLAAEKSASGVGGGPLVLLARPPSERGVPSVAGTRWLVEREAGSPPWGETASETTANPRWCVEVLRWKGRGAVSVSGPSAGAGLRMGGGGEVGRRWSLEWSHVEGAVVESPVVADGARAAPDASPTADRSSGGASLGGASPGDSPPGESADGSSVAGRSSEFLEARAPRERFGRGHGRAAAG